MMRPLSVFTFYLRNKLKLAPVFAVLALAVFGISLTGALTGTIKDAGLYRVEVYRRFAQVSPSFREGNNSIDAVVKADLYRNPGLEALYPAVRLSTYYPTLAGGSSTFIYALDSNAYALVMERGDIELAAGRLPRASRGEIAIHEMVAKARNLNIGDAFDPEKDEQEWLPGRLEVVGILRGPTVLSLASLDYIQRRREFRNYARSLLAIPHVTSETTVQKDLAALDAEKVNVYTFATELERFRQNYDSLDSIVWAINSVVVIVLSLLVGLLNMIYFLDRMNEFGLLLGIGYPRAFVIRRALVESLGLTVAAWAFGIVFTHFVYALLNVLLFEPRGMILSVLNWQVIQFTLPIPIIVGIFAASTVIWQLQRFDPITIIERRD